MLKKIINPFLYIFIIALIIFPIYYYLGKKDINEKLSYKTAYTTDIKKSLRISGTIKPQKEISIKSRISGVLDTIYVKSGDKIKKGQIIAKIKVIPNENNLKIARSILKQKTILKENKRKVYERNKNLFNKGVISKSEYEVYLNDYSLSLEEYNNSKEQLTYISNGNINSKNSNTIIKSTIDGIVTEVLSEIGMSIIESNNFNEGTTIVRIANYKEMIFEGKVKEYNIKDLKIGMDSEISLAFNPKKKIKGKLFHIDTKGQNIKGGISFLIKIRIDNYPFIRVGISGNANILIKKRDKVLAIKESWLKEKGGEFYLEILEGDNIIEKIISL
jgi:HlyD family secretion protein